MRFTAAKVHIYAETSKYLCKKMLIFACVCIIMRIRTVFFAYTKSHPPIFNKKPYAKPSIHTGLAKEAY